MKFISSIKKYAWILVAMPLVLTSCSKDIMDDINKDNNHALDAKAKFILSDVITRTAFSNAGGDISTYVSTYVEHEVGVHNQMFYAETRLNEPTSSSTFNNSWGALYRTLKDAKLVIAKTSEGGPEAGNDVTKGMAEVLAAYNLALLTDLYGDAPWIEAADYKVSMNPKIDKQEVIYEAIMAYLDAAIVDLQKSDVLGAAGANDLLYNGNASKWLKFAHGLKARYTMRLIKQSKDVNGDLQKVIDNVELSFASAADQAAFGINIYDASNLNPLFDFQWSRDGLGASRSMVDKLVERNDPRLRRAFVDADWVQIEDINAPIDPKKPESEDFYSLMAPNGKSIQQQGVYNTSIYVYSQTAPTLLLSYHELLFLKAEALARLGRGAQVVEPVLKAAVVAAIANTEVSVQAAFDAPVPNGYGGLDETTDAITTAEAETYFDTEVKPLLVADPLKEIMNQKYIAFFGASGEATETYNDIRRLKGLGQGDLIKLDNPGKFPLRLPYGTDDTTNNPEVQAAYGDGQYVYTEAVWWAGGTR